jgi:hypothetical protein
VSKQKSHGNRLHGPFGIKKSLKLVKEESAREKSSKRFDKIYERLKVSLETIKEFTDYKESQA